MKILQVNCVYKEGSTGKILNSNGATLREMGHDVFTCYGTGAKYYDEYSDKVCGTWEHKFNALRSRIDGVQFSGLYLSNSRLYRKIAEYNPDIIHIHCINGFTFNVYALLRFLAKKEIKTVVSLHAEFFYTGGCGHAYECEKWKNMCYNCSVFRKEVDSWFFDRSRFCWEKMNEAFSLFEPKNIRITAVSPWLAKRAKESAIMKRFQIEYVPNGVDTSTFRYSDDDTVCPYKKESFNVLFVTPLFNSDPDGLKGGQFIIEIASILKDIEIYIVASRYNVEAIKDLPSNVRFLGKAKSQKELSSLYSHADVTLLLSKRETFSMVTAESLCCGTPVVGFYAGGPESIALPEFSSFVPYGDVQQLCSIISRKAKLSVEKKRKLSSIAQERYSESSMAKGYLNVYKQIVG